MGVTGGDAAASRLMGPRREAQRVSPRRGRFDVYKRRKRSIDVRENEIPGPPGHGYPNALGIGRERPSGAESEPIMMAKEISP